MDLAPVCRSAVALLTAGLALMLGGGCMAPTYAVKVDALARPLPAGTQTFRLRSKDPRMGEENLRYREAAEFVRTALSAKGLYEAATEDKADLIVDFEFGMETPRTRVDQAVSPGPELSASGVRYETIPVTDGRGNLGYRTMAVRDASGMSAFEEPTRPRLVTVYEKFLRLSAREARPSAEGKPPAELWSIQVTAEDESNDLRKYLPVMAAATVDYLGQDSTSQRVVRVRADGPGVDFIRRGMGEPAAPATAPSGKP
jgi:hypothetical protein